jgi:hypothetical protein
MSAKMSKTTTSKKFEINALFYINDYNCVFIDGDYNKANKTFTYYTNGGRKVCKKVSSINYLGGIRTIQYNGKECNLRTYTYAEGGPITGPAGNWNSVQ